MSSSLGCLSSRCGTKPTLHEEKQVGPSLRVQAVIVQLLPSCDPIREDEGPSFCKRSSS